MRCEYCHEDEAHHWHGCANANQKSFCTCAGCLEVTEATTDDVVKELLLDPDRFGKALYYSLYTTLVWTDTTEAVKRMYRRAAQAVLDLYTKENP